MFTRNKNNRIKQNRNYDTLHTKPHVKISLSAITQLRKPGSLQLQVMLFCAGKPGHAALPPSRKVLWQKHLSVGKKQPRWHFLSLLASSRSHFPSSTPQGHCWPPHCGPAYTLLWLCSKRGPSRLFQLTKSQGAPGFLRLCFAYTCFPCCTQERACYWAPSSTECFIPSYPRTHVLVTATSFPAALQKIILTHLFSFKMLPRRSLSAPCCFDHILLACFSYVVTSVSHIQNKHCAFSSRFFSQLSSNLNITSTASEISFYSTMVSFPLNLFI